ncbi:hypothetical protein BACCIP111895_03756 [Neobacillus rhizosphaerae]|uniref:Uncharacterized protein n=1 Tax=Neobacillus rhizosphaerae TaxID=2880965 RepID=A0ABN8KVD7_9BACI|nr:hypothetical protein [Neobacillus rhizosphaerae]CAH2716569.1 hypothetical protein BACCIP111895_03756 [Neobacillus rhizosphaerae]
MKPSIEKIFSFFFEKRETRTHSKTISIVFLTLYSLFLLLSIINLLGMYEHKTMVINGNFGLALFVVILIDFITSRKK